MDTNITNKEWCKLSNNGKTELVGSKNGNVIGIYAGVMFECVEDKTKSKHSFIWKPLNR
jgi:hypothetical protein